MPVKTEPVHAGGTTLGYKIGAATAFTVVSQVIETSAPQPSVGEIDTSKLSSTVMTNIPGITDNGEVSFTVYAVPGDPQIQQLQTWSQASAVVVWQLQAPDGSSPSTGSTAVFSGWLKSYQPKGYALNGTPTADVTIRVTGGVTNTVGS